MTEQTQPVAPWYRSPLWLGVIGVALVFGGYQLSAYRPADEDRLARQLDDLDRQRGGDHPELGEKLRAMKPDPPFRWPGYALFVAGLAVCAATVRGMLREPPPEPVPP